MMRQYELVERVLQYDPKADEALLNRAYVYAMKAHGNQKRASGDPYFSHPLEVAAILTELKLDDATIVDRAAARRHRGHRRHARRDRPAVRPRDRRAGRRPDQDQALDLVSKKAEQAENFRKLLVAISSDIRVLLVKLADRAAQHAHARAHEAREPPAHLRGDARHLCAARRPHGHAGACARSSRSLPSAGCIPRPTQAVTAKLAELAQANEGLVEEIGAGARRASSPRPASRPRSRAARRSPISIWRKMENKQISLEQLSDIYAFRVIVDSRSTTAIACSASCTRPGARCRAASRTTSRRRSRTTTSRSTPRSSARAISASSCRSARARCTTSPSTASPRTPSTRTAIATANGAAPTAPASSTRTAALHLAAAPGRDAARRRQPGRVPRAHQARAVPGPGVLLHAQGPPDRPAARRDAARLRLRRAHRHRQRRRRRLHQRPPGAARHAAAQRRRGRDRRPRRARRRRPPGRASPSPGGRAPPSAARRAMPCARQYAELGRRLLASRFERIGEELYRRQAQEGAAAARRTSRVDDVLAAVGRNELADRRRAAGRRARGRSTRRRSAAYRRTRRFGRAQRPGGLVQPRPR